MPRHPLVIANWKMNTSLGDAVLMAQSIKRQAEDIKQVEIIIAPPAVWLYPVAEVFKHHPLRHLKLAAQNIHWAKSGALTGEISAEMVKHMVSYTLIGHSEREQFGETSETIKQKIQSALGQGICPIVFVGEKTKGTSSGPVIELAEELLENVEPSDYDKIILVYEPVWAIGGKEAASSHEIEGVIGDLRSKFGQEIRLAYGGSVNQDNSREPFHLSQLDGVIVGSASLKINDFIKIVESAAERHALKNAV